MYGDVEYVRMMYFVSTQLCSKQVKAYEVVRGQFDLDKAAPHQMHTQTPLSLSLSLYLPLHIIYT